MHEASAYEESSFVTLTYAPEFLPSSGSLVKRDVQLFMKRLRKFFRGERISFFACGEYGDTTRRAHYHAILFGAAFPDQVFRKSGTDGAKLYSSPTLDRLWKLGECLIGAVSFQSAAYVARYCVKKVTGAKAEQYYRRVDVDTGELHYVEPEFVLMSTRPAIGRRWYERFGPEVEAHDSVVARGREAKPPRYYDKLAEARDPESHAVRMAVRVAAADTDRAWAERKPARLAVREEVKTAQLRSLPRTL